MLTERHGGIRALARAMAGEGETDIEPTVHRWLALAKVEPRPIGELNIIVACLAKFSRAEIGKLRRRIATELPLVRPADGDGGVLVRYAEPVLRAANEDLAMLVPNARFFVVKNSGHDIHQDQPELVHKAIRQGVAGVRNPDTWYDLTSCCAK
jgi:pimeloyl-ACP methyl ester carboxylesterase